MNSLLAVYRYISVRWEGERLKRLARPRVVEAEAPSCTLVSQAELLVDRIVQPVAYEYSN